MTQAEAELCRLESKRNTRSKPEEDPSKLLKQKCKLYYNEEVEIQLGGRH